MSNPPYILIETWDQVGAFAGRLVAFRSRGSYFLNSIRGTAGSFAWDASGLDPRPEDGSGFALVDARPSAWDGRGDDVPGFGMRRLKTPDTVASNCALVDYILSGARMEMRPATAGELAVICAALADGRARFEYMDVETASSLLERM